MTTIVLAKPTASFLILVILGAVYVNVLGFMFYTDIDYNSVSAVNIVIAVALAIDGSVHICHAFLNASGTRDERARTALKVRAREAKECGAQHSGGGRGLCAAVVVATGRADGEAEAYDVVESVRARHALLRLRCWQCVVVKSGAHK